MHDDRDFVLKSQISLIIAWQHSGFRSCDAFDWTYRMNMVSITGDSNGGRWTMMSKPLYSLLLSYVWCGKCWMLIIQIGDTTVGLRLVVGYIYNKLSCLCHIMIPLNSITFDDLSGNVFSMQLSFFNSIKKKTLSIQSINEWPSLQPKIQMNDSLYPLLLWLLLLLSMIALDTWCQFIM